MRRTLLSILVPCVIMRLSADAADYYVNDAVTNNDVWCTAPGATGNDGLTPETPAPGIQTIVDLYDLEGGDVVRVDTGTYNLSANIVIGATDSGTSTNAMVRVLGSVNGTVVSRGSTASAAYGFHLNLAAFVRLEQLRIQGASQGLRIENAEHVEVANCEVFSCQYGVLLAGGSDHRVEGCAIHDHTKKGVLGSSSAGTRFASNQIYNVVDASAATGHGIDLFSCAAPDIRDNTVRNNGGDGIHLVSCSAALLSGNTVRSQSASGVYLYGCNAALLNNHTIRQNGDGLNASYSPGLTVSHCRIYSNSGRGVSLNNGDALIEHGLIYANSGGGLLTSDAGSSTIRNNTFYRNAGPNLKLAGYYELADVRNNIFCSAAPSQLCFEVDSIEGTWHSDYNVFFTTNSAAAWYWRGTRFLLSSWQHYTDRDRHSLATDPLFADPDGADNVLGGANGDDDDFHIQSTVGSYHGGAWTADGAMSPCMDAGDPDSDCSAEPAVNGGRVNLGAFGNTDQASRSTSNRVLRVLYPNGREIGFRRYRARWAATGPWQTNDLIKIQYSPDGGAAWFDCAAANPLNCDNSLYGWDISARAPGQQYLLRVVCLDNTNIVDASDQPFEIVDASPKVLYINDGSTSGDEWCSSAGSATNTGLTAASPLDTLDHLLAVYPEVGAGDEIRLDTGRHDSDRMIYLTPANGGADGAKLTLRGSSAGSSVLDGLADFDVVYMRRIDQVRLERLTITGGVRGVMAEGSASDLCDGVELVRCNLAGNSSYGLYMTLCTNALIQSNICQKASGAGIYANRHGQILDNVSVSNGTDGIRVSGVHLVRGNQCSRNGVTGIYASDGASQVVSNRCFSNSGIGMTLQAGAAIGNTVCSNAAAGVSLHGGADASRNVVYRNGSYGIYVYGSSDVRNNLIYDNTDYNLYMQTDGGVIANNTLVGGNGFYLGSDPNSVVSLNNIIQCSGAGRTAIYISDPPYSPDGFASDYNDVFVTDGASAGYWYGPRATLAAWQSVSLCDAHSLAIEPRFANPAASDYHLQSTDGRYSGAPFSAPGGGTFTSDSDLSFCVDAGDPTSDYSQESADNGGRVNVGAFGNTPDASRSPGERVSLVTQPENGAAWFGSREVTWLTRGPWEADTISLEYSADGGAEWHSITSGVDFAAGHYLWDTSALAPGTNYLLRIWRDGGGATGVCAGAFSVLASGPRTYYVNDASTANDVTCTAAGSDANDGLTPGTPKLTVQAVLDAYNLEPGDALEVDTGVYVLSATLIVTTNDVGASGSPVLIRGSTHADGSVLNRNNTSQNVIQLGAGAHYVRFESLRVTGGADGIAAEGAWNDFIRGVQVVGCTAYSNASDGVYLYNCTNALASGNTLFDNGSRGVALSGFGDLLGNEAWLNGAGLRLSGPGAVADNVAYQNGSYGIEVYGATGVSVEGNISRDNAGNGINASGFQCVVSRNRMCGNMGCGLYLANGSKARRNVIYSNEDDGIVVTGSGTFEVINNLIYDNGTNYTSRFNIDVQSTSGSIVNNTIAGGSGVSFYDIYWVTNRNNIIWTSGAGRTALHVENLPLAYEVFASDFNDLFATNGADVGYWSGRQPTLADWQFASGRDAQSHSKDPLFTDADGADDVLGGAGGWDDNFHLLSEAGSATNLPFAAVSTETFVTRAATSWCVDAGDPSSRYEDELDADGGRVNVGAFGNTADASLSPGTKDIELVVVRGGEVLRGVKRLRWITRGPWTPGDLVRLEWTDDYKNYHFLADVPYEAGLYDWDTSGMLPSGFYALRASKVNEWDVCDTSGSFAITGVAPMTFYVNDASTNGDVYCTAPGDAGNTGASPASPKRMLTQLLMDFALIPGDAVRLDTGVYEASASTVLRDSGSVAQSILLEGSSHGAVLAGPGLEEPILKLLGVDHWRIEGVRVASGEDHGIYVEGLSTNFCESIEIFRCTTCSNSGDGIHIRQYATNILVRENVSYENSQGIHFYSSGSQLQGEVVGNACYDNGNIGIRCQGTVHIVSNECYLNYQGIYSDGSKVVVERNRCRENDSSGITLYYGQALRNCCYLNGSSGITLYNNTAAEQNAVWNNDSHGITTVSAGATRKTVRNNLIYSNAGYGIYLGGQQYVNQSALVENNTLYGGDGIYVSADVAVTQQNNIVWSQGAGKTAVCMSAPSASSTFVSDFNNLYATAGAAIGFWRGKRTVMEDWRYVSRQDGQSVSKDPLFVNPAGADGTLGGTNAWDDNFHLRSAAGSYTGLPFTATSPGQFVAAAETSPCVDAAEPAAAWSDELSPTGLRRNVGAFGNTADASLSPETRAVELIAVTGGELLRGTCRLTWVTTGPWAPGDHVKLSWNGTNKEWDVIAFVPFASGYYDWDTTGWAPDHGQLRASISNGVAQSHVTGFIDLWSPTGLTFYVNDGFTTNDVYCSAAGDNACDGLATNTPKATLENLVQTYNLIPGDRIFIDTGTWVMDATFIRYGDSGLMSEPIRFIGSTHADGSLFNRNDTGWEAFYLSDCNHVSLENLRITGGKYGLSAWGSSARFFDGIRVLGCELYGHAQHGIYMGYGTNLVFNGNLLHHQTYSGIKVVNAGNQGTVNDNESYNNGENGIDLSGTFTVARNHCHHNTSSGMSLGGTILAVTNTCHENQTGISVSGAPSEANDNVSYLNTYYGLYASYGCDARRNRLYSNGRHGLYSSYESGAPAVLANNLAYDNARSGASTYYNMYVNNQTRILIENNTLYGGNGLYLSSISAATNRNNLIWANQSATYCVRVSSTSGSGGFLSDFNNLHASGGASAGYWSAARATLAAWQAASGKDTNSISLDPQFVDANGPDDLLGQYDGGDDDLHLKSTAGSWHSGLWALDETNSPSIDAGYTRSAFALEPDYNGLRINQGAFGNTAQASKTAYAGPFYTVDFTLSPSNGGTVAVWPQADAYPAHQVVEATATPAMYFGWTNWSGSASSTNRTITFEVLSDMSLAANFTAACSNTRSVPDWWLAYYGLPVSQAGAEADSDGDLLFNWEEYIADTVPTDLSSAFVIESLERAAGGGHIIRWASSGGRLYRVDGTTNLLTSFINLTNHLPATPPMNVFTDSVFSAEASGFYRIGVQME